MSELLQREVVVICCISLHKIFNLVSPRSSGISPFVAFDVVEGGQEAIEGMTDVYEPFEGGIAWRHDALVDASISSRSSLILVVRFLYKLLPRRTTSFRYDAKVVLQLPGRIRGNL